jgi:hypothetical protein
MFFSPTFLILTFYLGQTYLIALLLLALTAMLAAWNAALERVPSSSFS